MLINYSPFADCFCLPFFFFVHSRVRPENEKEKYCFKSRTVVRVLDERVIIFDPADTNSAHSKGVPDHFRRSRDQRYIFDRVFDQYSTQKEVYENTAKVLNLAFPLFFLYSLFKGAMHTLLHRNEQCCFSLYSLCSLSCTQHIPSPKAQIVMSSF